MSKGASNQRTMTMKPKITWQKVLLLLALVMSPLLLANCGAGGELVSSNHAGPAGPTAPSGWYFDMTVTPQTIVFGGSTVATIRVWDSQGNAVSGAVGQISMTGLPPQVSSVAFVTGENGIVYVPAQVAKTTVPGTVFLIANLEDSTLNLPVTVIAPSPPTQPTGP